MSIGSDAEIKILDTIAEPKFAVSFVSTEDRNASVLAFIERFKLSGVSFDAREIVPTIPDAIKAASEDSVDASASSFANARLAEN